MPLAPLSVLVASALTLSATAAERHERLAQPESAAPEADPSWAETPAGESEVPAVEDPQEAPPAEPATAVEGAAAPSPSPVTGSPVTAPAPVPRSELQLPEKKGTALMIVAGGLGGVGWLLMATRISLIRSRCQASDPSASVTEDNVSGVLDDEVSCFGARGVNALLWGLQAPVNAANWAVAPLAASKRAKYDAARDLKAGEKGPSTGGYVGGGAALLGAGVIGRVAVVYFRLKGIRNAVETLSTQCLNGETTSSEDFFKCHANRQTYFYLGQQFSSAAIAGGAGLLTYGLTYKKRRAALERLHPADVTARAEFSIAPEVSTTYTGLSGVVRF